MPIPKTEWLIANSSVNEKLERRSPRLLTFVRYGRSLLLLLLLTLLVSIPARKARAQSNPDTSGVVMFGPKAYVQTPGGATQYSETITTPAWVTGPFTLHIQNGNADGSQRASSATITLNGTQIAAPSDFGENVATVDRGITLSGQNTLQITLSSRPGCFLILSFLGDSDDHRPPELTIVSPSDGSVINTATPFMKIRFRDHGDHDEDMGEDHDDDNPRSSGTDWHSLRIKLDGNDITRLFTVRRNDATAVLPQSMALSQGVHTLTATLGDHWKNVATVSSQFTVDLTPPQIQILQPVSGSFLNTSTPTLNIQYSDNVAVNLATLKILVDNNDLTSLFTKTNSGATLTLPAANALPQGPNEIVAQIQDEAGNQASTSDTFNVDTTPPTISFAHPVAGSYSGSSSAAIAVNYSDDQAINAASLEVTVDGAALAMTAGSASATGTAINLSDGSHTLTATVQDQAGNSTSATDSFTVDTTAPNIQIPLPTAGALLNNGSPQITVNYSDPENDLNISTLQILINGVDRTSLFTIGSASATAQLSGQLVLPDGTNTVTANLQNLAGIQGAASTTFTVDTVPPSITIQAPASATNSNVPSASFSYTDATSGVDPNSVHVFVDGRDVTSLFAISGTSASGVLQLSPVLADGSHQIQIKLADRAGNTAQASLTFVVDTTPPVVTIASPANNSFLNNPLPSLQLNYNDGAGTGVNASTVHATLQLGTNPATDISSYFQVGSTQATGTIPTASPLADGTYTLAATVSDNVGNTTTAQSTFELDTVAPTYQIVTPAANAYLNTSTPSFQITWQDDRSGVDTSRVQVLIDGVDETSLFAITSSGATATLPAANALADGQHQIQVNVFDRAGNQAASTPQGFTIDTVPPVIIPVVTPSANAAGWNNTPVTITFTCTDAGSGVATCPPPVTVSSEGANQNIAVVATDNAGNSATLTVPINIDLTPPTVSVTSPANGAVVSMSGISVTGNVSDALSGVVSVSCNGVAGAVQGGTFACPLTLVAGSNTITVQAVDVAGNTISQSLNVTFSSGPTISGFSPASASVGTLVTIMGSGFTNNGSSSPSVTLSEQGGGTILAPISSASDTSISFVIPTGAATGPITITTNAQSASSTNVLTVIAGSSFTLAADPGAVTLLPGQITTIQISLGSTDGFTQLAALNVSGLPSGVSASFQPPQITAGQYSILTLSAPSTQTASASQLTISASAVVQGIQQSQSASVGLNVEVPGGATFEGRVAVTNSYDTPLAGVTVSFTGKNYIGASTGCTASTTTDAAGNFVLAGLPDACSGSQMIQYDPSTVTSPSGKYSGVTLSYVLTPGQVTTPGIVVHLPRVDNAETVMVQQNSSTDQTFTFASIPGVSITVYAGTTFSLSDGSQPNPFPLSVVEIPYNQLPEKMPSDPTQDPIFAMSIEPFNSSSSQPVAVSYPNRHNTSPGTTMPLSSLNPTLGMMVNYGTGTVSPDGTQVIPDPDPAYAGHAYGISHFDWHFPLPAPGPVNPSPDPDCPCAGDPVDFGSGILTDNDTDIAFGGARGQIALTRTYREMSSSPGPFGTGTNHNYDYLLDTTFVSSIQGQQSVVGLIMPDGNEFWFSGVVGKSFTNATIPAVSGATITNVQCGAFNGSGTPCSGTLRWKNGTVYQFEPLLAPRPEAAFLTAITDPNGNTTSIVHDAAAPLNIDQIVDPLGRALTLTYDNSSRITSITDPIGRSVSYTYNGQGKLATFTDVLGGVTKYDYDSQGRRISTTDSLGNTYTNQYDDNGRVIQQTAPDGGVTTFAYTQFNPGVATSPVNITTVTDPRNNTTTYEFNSAGFLEKITDAVGDVAVYDVDPATNQTMSVTDPLLRIT